MHHAPRMPVLGQALGVGPQDVQDVLFGGAIVDDHGQMPLLRQFQLRPEEVGLLLTQRQVGLRLPKIIQARLADGYDLGFGCKQGQFLHVAESNLGHFAGMQTDGGVNTFESTGNVQGLPRRFQIRRDADDLRHPRGLRALDHLGKILREVGVAKMRVRVDKHDA